MGFRASDIVRLKAHAESFMASTAWVFDRARVTAVGGAQSDTWTFSYSSKGRRKESKRAPYEQQAGNQMAAMANIEWFLPWNSLVRMQARIALGEAPNYTILAARGAWAAGTVYIVGDCVTIDASGGDTQFWVAILGGTGHNPQTPNSTFWVRAVTDDVTQHDSGRTNASQLKIIAVNKI